MKKLGVLFLFLLVGTFLFSLSFGSACAAISPLGDCLSSCTPTWDTSGGSYCSDNGYSGVFSVDRCYSNYASDPSACCCDYKCGTTKVADQQCGAPTPTQYTWYLDADGDGYYNQSKYSSTGGTGWATTGKTIGDCNDSNANIKPSALEICDGQDNDCDGIIDESNVCSNSCDIVVAKNNKLSFAANYAKIPSSFSGAVNITYLDLANGDRINSTSMAKADFFILGDVCLDYGATACQTLDSNPYALIRALSPSELALLKQLYDSGMGISLSGDHGTAANGSTTIANYLTTFSYSSLLVFRAPSVFSPNYTAYPFLQGVTFDYSNSGFNSPGFMTNVPSQNCVDAHYGINNCTVAYVGPSGSKGPLFISANADVGSETYIFNFVKEKCGFANSIKINKPFFAKLNAPDISISSANIGDTVLLIFPGASLNGTTINYSVGVYNASGANWWNPFSYFTKAWDNSQKILGTVYEPFTITQTDLHRFNASIVEINRWNVSDNISIISSDDSYPIVNLISPLQDSKVQSGSLVWFNQSSSDEDDLLQVTWNFGDGQNFTCYNYSAVIDVSQCNVQHAYSTKGVYLASLSVKGMNRGPTSSTQFFVYSLSQGINVVPIVSSPQFGTSHGNFVNFNASGSYVANCSNSIIGGNFVVGNLNCTYVHAPNKPANQPLNGYNLTFSWNMDGKPVSGNWSNYNSVVVFSYYFLNSGAHNSRLNLIYTGP